MLAPQIDNSEITTIEGISENSSYDDLREAFKKYHALQCGYCTPGFITTIVYLLDKKQFIKEEEIRVIIEFIETRESSAISFNMVLPTSELFLFKNHS